MRKHNRKLFAVLLSALMTFGCITQAVAEVMEPVFEEAADPVVFTEDEMEVTDVIEVFEEAEGDVFGPDTEMGSDLFLGESSTLGNLWDGWDIVGSDAGNKPNGEGSEVSPYVIETIGNLMWLSYQTAKGTQGNSNQYYVLNHNLDYSGMAATYGPWHPIGWYVAKESPANVKPFSGHFDGRGYTISGIDIVDTKGKNLQNVGLFGVLDDAEVRKLKVEADTICGYDYVGILAGQITGTSEVHDIEVSGYANAGISVTGGSSSAHVGGITGMANGDELTADGSVVLENCTLTNVRLNSIGAQSTVGGIAGTAANCYIIDSTVIAESNGFQGAGYVGGIAGSQTNTSIYEAYIDGTIGGNSTIAAGGVTGIWRSGGTNEIYVIQMDGEIGATNKALTHEGIIVGTRDPNSTFIYGTNKSDNAGYLFYNEQLKGKAVGGSGLTGDGSGAPKSAETGYWTDNELKYVIVEGSNTYPCADDRFFYEELEAGVKFLITQKLNRKFSVDDYAKGLRFSLDHYAPGVNGSPVKGYLLTIPMINAQNSPTDLDVAKLTAVAGDGSIYYKAMDKDSCAAVAAGTIVKVSSSPKNIPSENKFFQRVVDEGVSPEMVKRPTYTDSTGGSTEVYDMTYHTGGEYSFIMPESDCEINIFYEKVLSGIWTDPDATKISIVETRTGDRKKPQVSWTIKNENGDALCYSVKRTCPAEGSPMTWQLLDNSDVTPVPVNINFNSVSSTNAVIWSVDDDSLINMEETETTWTTKAAEIKPEVTNFNAWLSGIISSEEQKQANAGYKVAIPPTVYEQTAVLSARTDPDHSVNNISAYAHCDVKFTFQIIDQTTLLTEGVSLNKNELTFNVVRKLSGRRHDPVETFDVTGSQDLKATLTPAEANLRTTSWDVTGDEKTLTLTASGNYSHDAGIGLTFDGKDIETLPAWMRKIYDEDNKKKKQDPNYILNGAGTITAEVTVTADDTARKVWSDECTVIINYRTEDMTSEVQNFEMSTDALTFDITRTLTGLRTSPTENYLITSPKKITTFLNDNIPFLENVSWSVDSSIAPATVRNVQGTCQSELLVGVNFDPANLAAAPGWIGNAIRADNDKWNADKSLVRNASAVVTGYITAKSGDVTLPDGTKETARCKVTIRFTTVDNTTTGSQRSSSGSVSSGSGGGGGVSGGGTSVGTGLTKTVTGLPTYVISGTWVQSADKTWRFSSGRTYTAEWACVFNPYASGNQAQFDWFRFDDNSIMVRGWFDDPADGNRYYLWPLEDGTQGHMCVGCQYIEGAWYYLNEKSDGTRGKLMRSEVVTSSEGKTITTDASGRIIAVNGNAAEIASLKPTENTTESLRASGVIGMSAGTGTTLGGYTIVSNKRGY